MKMRLTYHVRVTTFYFQMLLIVMLLVAVCVVSEKVYIITSADQPCPGVSSQRTCVTLQEFANNSSPTTGPMPSELILELLPGFHSLQTQISAVGTYTNMFIMNGSNAVIQCSSGRSSGRMSFSNVQFVKINDLNFTNCGGADFYNVNKLVVDTCHFLKQQWSWSLDRVSNATIMRSSFQNGEVVPILLAERSSLAVKLSMFVNTTTRSGRLCEGAAINCKFSYLNIEQSHFLQNRVDCTIYGNGGAIYAYTTNVSITDSTFIENSALRSGGAIYANGGTLKLCNSLFTHNVAERGAGGAIRVYAIFNSISVSNSRFLNNNADFHFEGRGGAIYIEGRSTNISFIDATFSENSADSCGALKVISHISRHNISVINSSFTHNRESRMAEEFASTTAYSQFGGAACINGSIITFTKSNFTQNQAAGHAGVLHLKNSTILIEGSNFSGNRAQRNGGVIFTTLSSVAISIDRSSFTYNQAGGDGGVIYMRSVGKSGISQFTARGSVFGFNNAAKRGGVIAITGGQVDLEGSLIYDNRAESGGVVRACISEVKVQTRLLVMDDPANPQLCTFYDTDIDFIPPVTSRSEKFVSESKLNATFGVAITVCVVCLLLCVVIACIVLYLCGMLKCCKGRESGSSVDNTPVYVPLNERHD